MPIKSHSKKQCERYGHWDKYLLVAIYKCPMAAKFRRFDSFGKVGDLIIQSHREDFL